ncbi:MAG: uroporphyrinogen-III synthase [Rikenellaceae bacterium]
MKVAKILVSQPRPAVIEKSPFFELSTRQKIDVEFKPLIKVVGVSLKEFLAQRTEILDHTAVIFTSRTTVDSFFHICEEARLTVPEGMKYICQTEAVALYLQKYIVYRKRKISFADGTFTNFVELIVKNKAEKFLLTLTEPHKPELHDTLEKLKLNYSPVILARTISADMDGLKFSDFDLTALYSPSDVKALVEKCPADQLPVVATFGQATLQAAVDAGLKVHAMAPRPEAPSMVKAIDIFINQTNNGEQITEFTPAEDAKQEEFIRCQQSKLSKKPRVRRTTTSASSSSSSSATTTRKRTTTSK